MKGIVIFLAKKFNDSKSSFRYNKILSEDFVRDDISHCPPKRLEARLQLIDAEKFLT